MSGRRARAPQWRLRRLAPIVIVGCVGPGAVWPASVFVKALSYDNAEVVINGTEARALWVGETAPEGVTLRRIGEGAAVFDTDGKRWTLRPGEGTYTQTTLRADARGQFLLNAQVNGALLAAIIDTGATTVAMNSEDANRLSIDYLRGQRIVAQTASGTATAYRVTFASVQAVPTHE